MAFIMLRLSCCRNSHRPFKELDASEEENDPSLSILSFHIILLTGGGEFSERSECSDHVREERTELICMQRSDKALQDCRALCRAQVSKCQILSSNIL